MKILHYYSGITLCLFVAIHLLNHLMILKSSEAHIRFMKLARKVYRNPVVESLLLVAVFIQITTGLLLAVNKWNKAADFFEWVQIISGFYLSNFLIIHVTAVLLGRYKLRVDTNLYYGAGVMNMWPQKLLFIPYYSLAILSFFFHVAAIHRFKITSFVSDHAAQIHGFAIMIIGIIITGLIILKMSNLGTKPVLQSMKQPGKDELKIIGIALK